MSNVRGQVAEAPPGADSLTGAIAADVIAELRAAGAEADEPDLRRDALEPVVRPADEPGWGHPEKPYTPDAMMHVARPCDVGRRSVTAAARRVDLAREL